MTIDFTSFITQYVPEGYFQIVILNNSIVRYLSALVFFIGLLIIFYFANLIISANLRRLAKRTKIDLDDLALKVFKTLRPPFYVFLAFYFSLQTLHINKFILDLTKTLLILVVVFQAVKILQIIIDYISKDRLTEEKDRGTKMAMQTVGNIAKFSVWVFALLFILSNFGINITSLIAGLGIGGVAVALALQNILGDLFSYFAINFDKPFVPGDFIIVGDKMGVVEKIGIKTTRVRALQGEELVFSNKELSGSQIQNFKRMNDRRVSFDLGVVYGTAKEKLEEIPMFVKNIIESVENTRFDRAHFKNFGDFSLNFEVVYYVSSSDYNVYMNIGQEINLKIVEIFTKEGIEFAFPTQTVHLARS